MKNIFLVIGDTSIFTTRDYKPNLSVERRDIFSLSLLLSFSLFSDLFFCAAMFDALSSVEGDLSAGVLIIIITWMRSSPYVKEEE